MVQRMGAAAVRQTDREWYEVALVDRAEKAELEAGELRSKMEKLETELLIARLWVKELALWLDEYEFTPEANTAPVPGEPV